MSLIQGIKEASKNLTDGNIEYMPMPEGLGAFSKIWYPGRMKGQLTCITGGTSSMKTSLVKFIVFNTIEWAIRNNKPYKCLYFALEESLQEFRFSLLSYLLYKKTDGKPEYPDGPVRYNIEHFEGIGKAVDPKHFDLIEETEPLVEKFMSYIHVDDHNYNTYGIYKVIREYARQHGTFHGKNGEVLSQAQMDGKDLWVEYRPTNPRANVEVVIDHLSELSLQEGQKDLKDAMTKLVKDMRTVVCKKFNYHVIVIQQQMLEMENLEHIKENMVYASIQGLGDAKTVARAYLNMIGITNIHRYGLKVASTSTGSYDVSKLGDYQKVISIIKRRFGVSNRRTCLFSDGCCGVFKEIPEAGTEEYKKMLTDIKSYQ